MTDTYPEAHVDAGARALMASRYGEAAGYMERNDAVAWYAARGDARIVLDAAVPEAPADPKIDYASIAATLHARFLPPSVEQPVGEYTIHTVMHAVADAFYDLANDDS